LMKILPAMEPLQGVPEKPQNLTPGAVNPL
jgi:hypothetical protein